MQSPFDVERVWPLPDADSAVPLAPGIPVQQGRAFAAGRAVVDLAHFGVLRVTGRDRETWLHQLTSQDFRTAAAGESRDALWLDPAGRLQFSAAIFLTLDSAYLIVDSGTAEPLAAQMEALKFAARVEVENLSGQLAVLGTFTPAELLNPPASTGPDLSAIPLAVDPPAEVINRVCARLDVACAGAWLDPWPGVTPGGAAYAHALPYLAPTPGVPAEFTAATPPPAYPPHPGLAGKLTLSVVERTRARDVGEAFITEVGAGGQWASFETFEAQRIAMWRPRLNREADLRALPAELDWLRSAVHLGKGCYCGQEAVAKIVNMGKPPRRLVFLNLDGSQNLLPLSGARVLSKGGQEVGVVTSAARHFEEGPIALALVKRDLPVDAAVDVEAGEGLLVAGAQEEIVPAEGKSSVSPAERPGRNLLRRFGGTDRCGAGF